MEVNSLVFSIALSTIQQSHCNPLVNPVAELLFSFALLSSVEVLVTNILLVLLRTRETVAALLHSLQGCWRAPGFLSWSAPVLRAGMRQGPPVAQAADRASWSKLVCLGFYLSQKSAF